ncbi:MAG: hypothetical protein ACYC0Z_16705 [Acidobacteriaceae bacterium]
MGWESALPSKSTKRRCGPYITELTVSVTSSGNINQSTQQRPLSLTIKVPTVMLKKVRWVLGDRCELLKDSEKSLFLLKRSTTGYLLSMASASKGEAKKFLGRNDVTAIVKMPKPVVIKDERICATPCESATVEDEGIIFELPKYFIR